MVTITTPFHLAGWASRLEHSLVHPTSAERFGSPYIFSFLFGPGLGPFLSFFVAIPLSRFPIQAWRWTRCVSGPTHFLSIDDILDLGPRGHLLFHSLYEIPPPCRSRQNSIYKDALIQYQYFVNDLTLSRRLGVRVVISSCSHEIIPAWSARIRA